MKLGFPTITIFLLAAALTAVCWTNAFAATTAKNAAWNRFVDEFVENYFRFNPNVAVNAGRHEFDGKLPDWSASGIRRQIEWLETTKARADKFPNESLSSDERFERDYLTGVVEGQLFWRARARWHRRNPYFYLPALDPNVYLSRRYAPLETRLAAYIAFARNVPKAAREIQNNLQTPLPKEHADFGAAVFAAYADFYEKETPKAFSTVNDKKLLDEMRGANATASETMRELARWFEAQKPAANGDFALGEKLFAEMLRATEGVNEPLAEIEKTGKENLALDLEKLKKACDEFAPGKTLSECVAEAQNRKPAGGAVAAAWRQVAELKNFIVEKRIVSIPGDETLAVEETLAYKRGNLAGIESPGFYDRRFPSVYYISPPDPAWTEAAKKAYVPGEANLLFITAHEVFPGHFVQTMFQNRAASKIARLFVGFGFSEGWAHYAEEMMWEEGFWGKTAELRVGQLLLALLRDVRLLAAIGLRTGRMTVPQAEKLFREAAFQDEGNARQQAFRGTIDPAYLMYTLGKLEVLRLRADWFKKHGKAARLKDFHDRLLSNGSPPLGLARRALFEESGK